MPLNMLNTLNTLNILDGVGQWLVHTVGWLSIELLVFACVVYAITRSDLVRSSRVKRWLWTLVLVKPLVAAALGWPLHLATDSRADIAPMAAASVQAVVQPASGNPPLAAPADGTTAALDPASATTLHHTVRRDVGPRLSGFAVLAMLWIGGVASMAGYTVLGALWLGRVRRLAMPLEWADIAASCHEHAPAVQTLMARVDVRLTTRINEPCVYGFFRPSILVPAWCIEDDAPPNLAYILLHEGAHCRARDHWLLWFRRAMETFLWFHPVVWFAGQKAMAEAENVCDEAVVARAKADGTPSAALLYSSCLMRVLERATRHQFEAFVPGVIPTAERIRRLVQQRPTFGVLPSPAAWLAVAAFAVAALPGVLTARSAFATRAVESFLTGRPEVVRDIVYASKLPGDYFFNLYLVRSDGSGLIRLTDDRAEYGHPQWSPSGDRIAAQSRPHRNTHWGVYILDADGARLQRIGGPVTHDRPSWSPDGSRLATGVHGDESGDAHRNIYVSTVDGTESHRITDDLADYARAAWSPEGRDIALVRRAPGRLKWELALIAADGSDLRIIADASARGVQMSAPAWSPDGGRLAYLAYSGGSQDPCELRILDLGTLESTVVGVTSPGGPDFVSHLTWSPEEDYLVIADRRLGDTRNRLYRVSLATGETVALTSPISHRAREDA